MELETININDLKPAEYNPRVMPAEEQRKLKKNLESFGLIDPIIIDLTDDNTIIGGHQRAEVLKEIDDDMTLHLIRLGDVGLVIRETDIKIKDKNDQKAMNLSLNKIDGDWDWDLLENILIEMTEDHYTMDLTGFDNDEIQVLMDDVDYTEVFEEIDVGIEEPDEELEVLQDNQKDHRIVYISFVNYENANTFLESIEHNTFFKEDGFKKIVVDGDDLAERINAEKESSAEEPSEQ